MKAYLQDIFSSAYNTTQVYNLYYMSGTVPTTQAAVKSAVDLSDMSDLHSKCVGVTAVLGTTTFDTTGIGSFKTTFSQYDPVACWLKGGYTQQGAYYLPMPSRIYYNNGRKSTYGTNPPFLFSLPISSMLNSTTLGQATGFNYRDNAGTAYTLKASGSEIGFILEYDQSTTVSSLRVRNGTAITGSDYVYYANVDYWNGTAWVNAYTGATVLSVNSVTTVSFTAVTATKFRVYLFPYTETSGYSNINCCSVALMHTAPPATVAVADITWGVLVPTMNASTTTSPFNSIGAAPKSLNVDPLANPAMDSSSSWYGTGKGPNLMPAIIDTCGQDSVANKMVISQSSGLTSNMRPTLSSYSYFLGELV